MRDMLQSMTGFVRTNAKAQTELDTWRALLCYDVLPLPRVTPEILLCAPQPKLCGGELISRSVLLAARDKYDCHGRTKWRITTRF